MQQAHTISAGTGVVALLGDPVAHSLSPALHNTAFAARGLDLVYVALRVAPTDLEAALRGLATLRFVGANITFPHKEAALGLMDEVREDAALIGAVNTVVVDGPSLIGHNTDSQGFQASLRELAPEGVGGRSAVLLGAGGAGRAVALALARAEIGKLIVADLSVERSSQLKEMVARLAPELRCEVRELPQLSAEDVRAARLVVNATPLGLTREEPATAPPDAAQANRAHGGSFGKVPRVLVDNVGVDQIVYDVVYGARTTEFVSAALAAGARAADGRGMLTWQAALSFQLWTGVPAPIDEMKSVVRR